MSRKSVLSLAIVLAALACLCLPAGAAPAAPAAPTGPIHPGLVPAVVYVSGDGDIHEIALKGSWSYTNLTAAAGAPRINPDETPMPFLRSDGVSMVVYKEPNTNHVIALNLDFLPQGTGWVENWKWTDLTVITGAPVAHGQPYGYVRGDGVSAIVYLSYLNGEYGEYRIVELWLKSGWHWDDLTDISGAPEPLNNPTAYVRSDGVSAILYLADVDSGPSEQRHIIELRLDGGWKAADLTQLSGAPDANSAPSAYVRSDGISAVNYIDWNGDIQEIRLEDGWIAANLSDLSTAPAASYNSGTFGFARSDGINTIVYHTPDRRIVQLYLDHGWQAYDTTSVPNAVPGWHPAGYVRADGISAIVYRGEDYHVQEIRLENEWVAADLTQLASAPSFHNIQIRAYNRSGGPIHRCLLPIVLRAP